MLTNYLVLVSIIVTATLIWRNLKDDHPKFKAWVRSLPIVGASLSCGFCMSLWTTGAAVIFYNPLALWIPPEIFSSPSWVIQLLVFCMGWMSVGFGVLLFRNIIIVLMEAGAVLKHLHENGHRTH